MDKKGKEEEKILEKEKVLEEENKYLKEQNFFLDHELNMKQIQVEKLSEFILDFEKVKSDNEKNLKITEAKSFIKEISERISFYPYVRGSSSNVLQEVDQPSTSGIVTIAEASKEPKPKTSSINLVIPPYACSLCDKAFNGEAKLALHYRLIHNLLPSQVRKYIK
ncbi:hypothetical protein Mgra_00005744 [Meloidogyne graminicola]|uniref:C2H2-type domain-containing protein n=1 Tax=Meloidogyne graminicola TaxID=189291 RepID=A0A8S9ZN54_9BILA|nr:hypothetical protein Mgra_00005744 [Meloidogyne graminicola]